MFRFKWYSGLQLNTLIIHDNSRFLCHTEVFGCGNPSCPDSFGSSKFHSSTAFLCAGARCIPVPCIVDGDPCLMGQGGGSLEKPWSGEVGNLGPCGMPCAVGWGLGLGIGPGGWILLMSQNDWLDLQPFTACVLLFRDMRYNMHLPRLSLKFSLRGRLHTTFVLQATTVNGRLLLESKASPLVRSYTKWESGALSVGRDDVTGQGKLMKDLEFFWCEDLREGHDTIASGADLMRQKHSLKAKKTSSWEFRRVIAVCSKNSVSR